MKSFTVTEDHIKLLGRMYVGWDYCEFGAPAIDCKRPYGNSDVTGDILEIVKGIDIYDDAYLESDDDYNWARSLHLEMQTVLQIMVDTLSIKPGIYVDTTGYGKGWKLDEGR